MDPPQTQPTGRELLRIGLKIARDTMLTRGRNFIYLPRRYDSHPEYAKWKESVETIGYQTGSSAMKAFLDCDPDHAPDRIWLLFGGNASVALDWLPITSFAPPSRDAFLLFDYPGYGDCQGKPSRRQIRACIDEVISHLVSRFAISPPDTAARFCVMGHSLGGAVALDTANRYSLSRAILISPFSSVRKMGELMFGKILPIFAADNYDNIECLKQLALQPPAAEVHIIHGVRDEVIPLAMARQLHEAAPGITQLHEIAEANHNDILMLLAEQLAAALTNGGNFSYEPNPHS